MNPPPTPFRDLTTMKKAKRILVATVGGTVLGLGIALVVLPGPAFLVIPAGLAILAVEFAWARRWLLSARNFWRRAHQPPERRQPGGLLPTDPAPAGKKA